MTGFAVKAWLDETASHETPVNATALKDLEERLAAVGVLVARVATTAALPANTRTGNKLEANANAELAKQDETTLAIGDYLLVKNEATGANNGLYKVTAIGSGVAKWVMERAIEANTSEKSRAGSTIYVQEGKRCADRIFTLTTNAPITLNTTALTFAPLTSKDFGIVEALPTTEALKGDRCSYKAAAGIYWDLIYTEEATYPWAKTGGPPLSARDAAGERKTTSEVPQTTGAPSITAPLKMEFAPRIGCKFFAGNTAVVTLGEVILFVNAVTTGDYVIGESIGGSSGCPLSKDLSPHTAESGQAIQARYQRFSSGEATFQEIWLVVDPIRVG